MVSGCLSVYYSCVLQRKISRLYNASLVRDFLQVVKSNNDEKVPSLAAIIIVSAPFSMIKLSIVSFVLGLAIYQGFTWTRRLDTTASQHDSRDVFVFFITGILFCFYFFEWCFITKTAEAYLLDEKTRDLHSFSIELDALQTRDQGPSGQGAPRHSSELHLRSSVDGVVIGNLTTALEAAAIAHAQCAEADRRVAAKYESISPNITHNYQDGIR